LQFVIHFITDLMMMMMMLLCW